MPEFWKLALVAAGAADPALLDSYEAERWPVGRALLRSTDRLFAVFTRSMSSSAIAAWVRRVVVARVLPRAMRAEWTRAAAFRFVSELGIRYRASPAVTEGTPSLEGGPRAGDRMPDAELTLDGRPTTLQREVGGPHHRLLLCGDSESWGRRWPAVAALERRYAGVMRAHRLTQTEVEGSLIDRAGRASSMLGVRGTAQYLVRPDGYIAYRCAETDLGGIERYLVRWFGSLDR